MAVIVCLGLAACRRVPSEYSAEMVLRTVSRHPVFEEIAYEKLEAKVAATDGRVRLETPDFVLILSLENGREVWTPSSGASGRSGGGAQDSQGRGWLLLKRGRLEVEDPGKPGGPPPKIRQPMMRKYIALTPQNLSAWPRLGALVVLASQLAPPPDGKAHVCVERAKDCRKVATEAIGGRAAEKWEYVEGDRPVRVWTDAKLGIPVRSDLFEVKSIFVGPQERELFERPSEYEEYGAAETPRKRLNLP
ncbi:MAG TPA: hypothetical protein VNK82_05215 [Terriglobales bacterium]|nr:hypothetical protein [Terriglobales bacterium]